MIKSILMLVLGFGLGTLFVTYPTNKAQETFCFNDDRVGVVQAEHMNAILFTVLNSGFKAGAPGALEDLKLEKASVVVACPEE